MSFTIIFLGILSLIASYAIISYSVKGEIRIGNYIFQKKQPVTLAQNYVISLDRTPERYIKIKQELEKNQISHVKFSAVDGHHLEIIDEATGQKTLDGNIKKHFKFSEGKNYKIIRKGYDLTYKYNAEILSRLLTPGELGVYCSNYAIWKEIVKKNLNAALILEDDAIFIEGFNNKLRALLQNAPQDWDIIFLYAGYDPNKTFSKIINNRNFWKVNSDKGEIWGLVGYVVNNKGAKKLVREMLSFSTAVDNKISELISRKILNAYYSPTKLVVHNDNLESSINSMGRREYEAFGDFDIEMGKLDACYKYLFMHSDSEKSYNFFKALYNKNKYCGEELQLQLKIPKIIHQIWVGPGSIPPILQIYARQLKELHPTWEYRLWTDKEVENFDFSTKDLYLKARNYAEKADLLRQEVLFKFGGVYLDLDIQCLKPLDPLHHLYEAYYGLEFPLKEWGKPIIANAVIGSVPGHKVIAKTLELIRNNWEKVEEEFENGNYLNELHYLVVNRTMAPVTDSFLSNVSLENDKVIALPAQFFYPVSAKAFEIIDLRRKWRTGQRSLLHCINDLLHNRLNPEYSTFLRPKAFSFLAHDYSSNLNILLVDDFWAGMGRYDLHRRQFINSLDIKTQRKLVVFSEFYKKNDFGTKSFTVAASKTPEIIHFIEKNNQEAKQASKINIDAWKKLNPNFEIKIWELKDLEEKYQHLVESHDLSLNQKSFIFSIALLNEFGGVYVNNNAIPVSPIFELANKYDFFAGLNAINGPNEELTLSDKLYGGRAHHQIFVRILEAYAAMPISEKIVSDQTLNDLFIEQVYKNIALDGVNIVLPAVYFDPIKPVEGQYKTLINKVRMKLMLRKDSFTGLTFYTIIQ